MIHNDREGFHQLKGTPITFCSFEPVAPLGDIDERFWGRNILRPPSEPDLVNEHMVMWHLCTVIDGGWCYIRISRWWQGG
jgi:hypothetical protein